MKTVISKENAIAILEGVVVQQAVAVKIMELTDSVPDNLFVETFRIAKALFNINTDNATPDEAEEVMSAITDTVENSKLTVTETAESIYRKLEILSRLENLQIK